MNKDVTLINIRPAQAHVWTLPVNQGDDSAIERLEWVLSTDEQARAERFSDPRSHRQYLGGHILAHHMLSHFSTVDPADWRFSSGPHGRPEPADDLKWTGLRFNLSHARGMVACGVCLHEDIGVDVEWLERDNLLDDIAERKFSRPEADAFRNAPPAARRRMFFSFWTLKESYIKAIGQGLIEPLDGFAFELDPLAIRFLEGQDQADRWSFVLFQPSPVHLAALSLAHRPAQQVDICRRHLSWGDLR